MLNKGGCQNKGSQPGRKVRSSDQDMSPEFITPQRVQVYGMLKSRPRIRVASTLNEQSFVDKNIEEGWRMIQDRLRKENGRSTFACILSYLRSRLTCLRHSGTRWLLLRHGIQKQRRFYCSILVWSFIKM